MKLTLVLLVVGFSSLAFAGAPPAVPEISAVSGVGALTLLSGAILVLRGRRKR